MVDTSNSAFTRKGKPFPELKVLKRGGIYVTGGMAVDFTEIRKLYDVIHVTCDGGYLAEIVDASVSARACKVLVRGPGNSTQVADSTNLSAVTFRYTVRTR